MSSIEAVAICPVLNLKIEDDFSMPTFSIKKPMSIEELQNNYAIRDDELTEWEKIFWTEYPLFEQRFDPTGMGSMKTFTEPQILLNHILNSIMLYKPWSRVPLIIGTFTVRQFRNGEYAGSAIGGHIPSDLTSPSPLQPKVNLLKSEYQHFRKFFDGIHCFFSNVNTNEIKDRVTTAYYWFQKSRETIKAYDRLIFLTTALETLISQNEGELSYRISHRTAALLGENESERYAIYLTVKELYDLRSRVVHGTPNTDVKYYDAEYLQEIVRVLILRFISLIESGYGKRSRILRDIDNSVFDSEIRLDLYEKSKKKFNYVSTLSLRMTL